MNTITLSTGKFFPAIDHTAILDSAAAAGVVLPYSCKTGRCSSCKCKVTQGTTTLLHPETGLTEQEKSEGWILSCVRAAASDLVIEVEDLGDTVIPKAKTWPCRISEITRLAPDVVKVMLRMPPAADFQFLPGQYLDVIGPGGVRRSYSLANADFNDKQLELHIRAVDGGEMSQYWFSQAKQNDLLRLNGPLGTFFLRDIAGKTVYFLATGTGIAPIKSMLEAILGMPAASQPQKLIVLWGGRYSYDLYLQMQTLPDFCTYIPVVSRPDDAWSGATGHIQDVLLATGPDLSHAVVYACGSNAMINGAKDSLIRAGLPAANFYSDAFVSSGND